MPDRATTKRRNCADEWKRQWYATYRSARSRKRFGDQERSRRAVIETAVRDFRTTVTDAVRLVQ